MKNLKSTYSIPLGWCLFWLFSNFYANRGSQLKDRCDEYGLKINLKKTKLMVVTKSPQNLNHGSVTIANTTIENVPTYKYLGTWIERSGDQTREIRTRIEIARSTFIKMKKLFTNRDINMELRMRVLRFYVFSTLLYGVESCTL